MLLFENHDIYNNLAIEAVIDFHWRRARSYYFFSLFLPFLIFAICFGLISWAYLNHSTIINHQFLFIIIILFYYLAFYLFFTEILQLFYKGSKKYFFNLCNIFDVISVIFAVIIISIIVVKNFQFSDGFKSTENNIELTIGISFSIFLIWIEFVSNFNYF